MSGTGRADGQRGKEIEETIRLERKTEVNP